MQQLPASMAYHVFLTGEKQIGKSTLVKKVLGKYAHCEVGGFFTLRTNAFLKDSYSVHMFGADEEVIPGKNNLLFVCGKANAHISERFDRLGCEILSKCADCSLIIMDELGPHEAHAELFHNAVLRLLDGNVPILGVLQSPPELFWPDIVRHSNVQIIEISERNRDDINMIDDILSVLT